jgi:hypothetical protein
VSVRTIYMLQDIAATEYTKLGQTDGPLMARAKALRTGAPMGLLALGCANDADDFGWHDHFKKSRVRADGEWFRTKPLWDFLRSETARELGWTVLSPPLSAKEDCRKYHTRVGTKEALHNLRTYDAFAAAAIALAGKNPRGGRVFWECVSGVSGRTDQPSIARVVSERFPLLDRIGFGGLLMNAVSVGDKVFEFYVLAEACERAGIEPHPRALRTGVVPRCPRVKRENRRSR